ncbi:unnamed protein product [Moneuplotes crassus]|uniref:Uncharacterized protein n=1 Tax=Euplotes crassus TaxID=5936 RepID=A0AAD1X5I3_EUPCR|nr:unnamed protein product [Moneuplotes crassus]
MSLQEQAAHLKILKENDKKPSMFQKKCLSNQNQHLGQPSPHEIYTSADYKKSYQDKRSYIDKCRDTEILLENKILMAKISKINKIGSGIQKNLKVAKRRRSVTAKSTKKKLTLSKDKLARTSTRKSLLSKSSAIDSKHHLENKQIVARINQVKSVVANQMKVHQSHEIVKKVPNHNKFSFCKGRSKYFINQVNGLQISEHQEPKTNVFQRLCPKESYPQQDFAKPHLKHSCSRGQLATTFNTLCKDNNEVKEAQVSIDPKLNQIFIPSSINSPKEMAKHLNVNPNNQKSHQDSSTHSKMSKTTRARPMTQNEDQRFLSKFQEDEEYRPSTSRQLPTNFKLQNESSPNYLRALKKARSSSRRSLKSTAKSKNPKIFTSYSQRTLKLYQNPRLHLNKPVGSANGKKKSQPDIWNKINMF